MPDVPYWDPGLQVVRSREAEFFAVFLRNTKDGLITVDEDGVINGFSLSAQSLFDRTPADVVGADLHTLFLEPFKTRLDGFLDAFRNGRDTSIFGQPRRHEACRASGSTFVADVSMDVLTHDNRPMFVTVVRDITALVEGEKREGAMERQLEKVARLKMLGEFSTVLAHEVNQPLAVISNLAAAAQRQLTWASPDVRTLTAQLGNVKQQAILASEIIRRMSALVEQGRVTPERADLREIVEDSTRIATLFATERGLDVALDIPDDLPAVHVDRVQLRQVFVNLLRNAEEAVLGERTVRGKERAKPFVWVRAACVDGETVRVSVTDNGPGLEPEMRDCLFEPFKSSKPRSTGVGLAMCRLIVEEHGGRIWANGSGGGGLCIQFTLPVSRA
ncbi:MAG: ATP-binding protein [Pseudomonadota bacterium]